MGAAHDAGRGVQTDPVPPLILISRGAFGSDVREAQMRPEATKRYRQLREQILAMPEAVLMN